MNRKALELSETELENKSSEEQAEDTSDTQVEPAVADLEVESRSPDDQSHQTADTQVERAVESTPTDVHTPDNLPNSPVDPQKGPTILDESSSDSADDEKRVDVSIEQTESNALNASVERLDHAEELESNHLNDDDDVHASSVDLMEGLPQPAPGPPSPLSLDGRGEEEYGERWWLKGDAPETGASPLQDENDSLQNDESAQQADMAANGEELDLTDPNALRPAHVPHRAAVEVDRRRLDDMPSVFESEEQQRNRFILIGVAISVIIALILAFAV